MLIDTHSHIFLEEFDQDREATIERARNAGVEKIILPNVDRSTYEELMHLCQQFPQVCLPAMGLHPGSVDESWEQELAFHKEKLFEKHFIAVGEIGIDLYWDQSHIEAQKEVFDAQLKWAKALKLPVIIHQRSSYKECVEVVKQNHDAALKGVFHCFTGSYEQGMELIEMGFYLGIGGILTFKNAGLDKVVSELPLEKLILETDSPYLSPVPYRGKRNESAYVQYVAQKLADIKTCSLIEIANQTSLNAEKLFSISEFTQSINKL